MDLLRAEAECTQPDKKGHMVPITKREGEAQIKIEPYSQV